MTPQKRDWDDFDDCDWNICGLQSIYQTQHFCQKIGISWILARNQYQAWYNLHSRLLCELYHQGYIIYIKSWKIPHLIYIYQCPDWLRVQFCFSLASRQTNPIWAEANRQKAKLLTGLELSPECCCLLVPAIDCEVWAWESERRKLTVTGKVSAF